MPQPTLNLTANSDGTVSSLFPSGDKPSGTLAYKNVTNPNSTPVQGDVLVLTTSTLDFGTDLPYIMYKSKLENANVGTLVVDSTPNTGTFLKSRLTSSLAYNNADTLPVHSVPEMPYGKAIAIGSPNFANTGASAGAIKAVYGGTSTKSFTHHICYFPAANQENWYNTVGTSWDTGWGIKTFWDMYDASNNTNINMYSGSFRKTGTGAGSYLIKENLVDTNNAGKTEALNSVPLTQCTLNPATVAGATSAYRHRTTPLIQQKYFSIASGTDGRLEKKLLDTSGGIVYDFDTTRLSKDTNFGAGINLFQVHYLNTQCNGFPVDVNAHYYVGDIYVAYGEGAPCRVEISDSSSPTVAAGTQKKVSVTVMSYISNKYIVCTVDKGWFYNESLSGKYLHVYDKNNQFLASTVIA